MDAVGIIALGGNSIMDGQQHVPQFRQQQINPGRRVQPPGFAGFFLHQDSNILVEQEKDQDHGTDKQPVQAVIEQYRHRVQMVHGIYCRGVEHQMDQHHNQQGGKGFMQLGMLFFRGEIDIGHKGQYEK